MPCIKKSMFPQIKGKCNISIYKEKGDNTMKYIGQKPLLNMKRAVFDYSDSQYTLRDSGEGSASQTFRRSDVFCYIEKIGIFD